MTTFKKLLRPISALSVLALGSALSFTVAAATPAPEFDIQGKPDFEPSARMFMVSMYLLS